MHVCVQVDVHTYVPLQTGFRVGVRVRVRVRVRVGFRVRLGTYLPSQTADCRIIASVIESYYRETLILTLNLIRNPNPNANPEPEP